MEQWKYPVELADSVWWVGARNVFNQLNCNSYLIADGEQGVLIDPGSVRDFEQVYKNVSLVMDPERISHFILHHQDPDLCSAIPLFEKKGIIRPLVTHWRSSVIIFYYGVEGPFHLIDRNGFQLTLASGRVLRFLHTPYLHFPGAIVTWDEQSKILFSSDLFGAFFIDESLQELFAGPDYIEAMKAFHEHYMPSNELLRPIMEILLNMEIEMIAPQHGSIIREKVSAHICALRDLECGVFLHPIRKEQARKQGYVGICNEVLRRCHSIAGLRTTVDVFRDTDIVLDEQTGFIVDFSTSGEQLWHNMFQIIQNRVGIGWLSALEVMVRRLSTQYSIDIPDVYEASLVTLSRQAEKIGKKYQEAKALTEELTKNITETREQLLHDKISGLYNSDFFMQYLQNDLSDHSRESCAFHMISIDNLQTINFRYGSVKGDETVRSCALLLEEQIPETVVIARLEGALLGVYFPDTDFEHCVQWSEKFRRTVEKSEVFIEPVTVSVGAVHRQQAPETVRTVSEVIQFFYRTAGIRIRIAKKRGANYICSTSGTDEYVDTSGKVLLVDTDRVHIDIVSTMLQQMDMTIEVAVDGEDALRRMETFAPDIVISEMMVPKIDGFGIREKIVESSAARRIPFILISHVKDDDLVERAHQLHIVHYFKKPYLLSELVGLVKTLIRGGLSE